jgi:hypothetical protein
VRSILTFLTAPKCPYGHRYKLKVERAIVIKMLTMSDLNERPRRVRVTRLFTCPLKNEEFQARFILTDTSWDRIKDVQVAGITNDNG